MLFSVYDPTKWVTSEKHFSSLYWGWGGTVHDFIGFVASHSCIVFLNMAKIDEIWQNCMTRIVKQKIETYAYAHDLPRMEEFCS
jgi:hypothetical protein